MPKFITIGYGSKEGYDRTEPAVRNAAHAHDARLRENGTLMGIAGAPIQVRNHNAAHVETRNGPFMSSALPIAGFAVVEAASDSTAIASLVRGPLPSRRYVRLFGQLGE